MNLREIRLTGSYFHLVPRRQSQPRLRTAAYARTLTGLLALVRREMSAPDYLAVAAAASELGQYRLAVAVLDRAENRLGVTGEITRTRRLVPGYVGRVTRRQVLDVASAQTGRPVTEREVTDEPVEGGLSAGTVAVVRHVVRGQGTSFIRKSLHRSEDREALLYGSGLVDTPGRWWRAPTVFRVAGDAAHWHLFLEDLQPASRPRTSDDFATAARGLGELNARGSVPELVALDWLRPPPTVDLDTHTAGISACGQFLRRALGRRLIATHRCLLRHEKALTERFVALPGTFCHGDAHAGNVILDPTRSGRVVLIDWSMAHLGPAGRDLGRLLSVPYMSSHRGMNPDRCRDEYLETLALPTARTDDVLFAYRYEMVWRSLKWWATRPVLTKRRLRSADVTRICDAAENLLEQVPAAAQAS